MGNTPQTSAKGEQETLVGSIVSLRNGDSCRIDKELARGGFSVVCACTQLSDGKRIALKRINTQSQEAEQEALGEVRAHAILGNATPVSEYIVPLFETHINRSGPSRREFSLIFPLFTHGNLSDFLVGRQELDEKQCLELFLCCASAVSAVNEKGIAHCDVKTHNFMLTEDMKRCILIDFGSSRGPPCKIMINTKAEAMLEQERAERFCSAAYRAPELWDVPFKNAEVDFSKSDVFALGCVLYSMCFQPLGYSPFESPTQGILGLAARTASFSFPQDAPPEETRGARALIKDMLAFDPKARITSKEVVIRVEALLKELADEDFDTSFS